MMKDEKADVGEGGSCCLFGEENLLQLCAGAGTMNKGFREVLHP